MSATVSKKNIKPEDEFVCEDCGEVTTGKAIINGQLLFYSHQDKSNPNNSTYRCIDCQDERFSGMY
jgi:DNA-directed RNA polymerase subunit RPC12/RpoP